MKEALRYAAEAPNVRCDGTDNGRGRMAAFGLPGAGERWVILVVFLLIAGVPGWAMYHVAGRVGYSRSAQWGWAAAYVFSSWIALLVFAFAEWPSGPEAANRTSAST